MNWQRCGKMRSWSNLSYFAGIGLEELKKKTECLREATWSPGENLNENLSKIKHHYNRFGRNIPFCDVDLSAIISRILGAVAKLQKVTTSFLISVSPSTWNNSVSTGRIFSKFYI